MAKACRPVGRGNGGGAHLSKQADYKAFERILEEGLARYDVQLLSFQLMPNHWHLVVRSGQNSAMSQFLRWITAKHTMLTALATLVLGCCMVDFAVAELGREGEPSAYEGRSLRRETSPAHSGWFGAYGALS